MKIKIKLEWNRCRSRRPVACGEVLETAVKAVECFWRNSVKYVISFKSSEKFPPQAFCI